MKLLHVSSVLVVLTAPAWLGACISDLTPNPEDALGTDNLPDPGETGVGDGDDDDSATGDGEGYEIRGRAVLPSLRGEECPFLPGSAPCTESACLDDHMSEACQDIVEQYCAEVPEDPGCDHGPGDTGDGDPGDSDPGDGDPGDGDPGDGDTGDHGDGDWPDEPEETYTPDSLRLLIHSVEFSADAAGCSDPILVGQADEPEYVDFFDNPTLITADPPPAGTYPCIIITMSDHIQWSSSEEGACFGEHAQDVASADDAGGPPDGEESQIRVYFSTAGEAHSDGKDVNAFEPPGLLLAEPHVAGEQVLFSTLVTDAVDKVQLRWEGEGLVCDMQPPVLSFETTYVDG